MRGVQRKSCKQALLSLHMTRGALLTQAAATAQVRDSVRLSFHIFETGIKRFCSGTGADECAVSLLSRVQWQNALLDMLLWRGRNTVRLVQVCTVTHAGDGDTRLLLPGHYNIG
jgi:hypothetical protein